VIIPVYNCPSFVLESVTSALLQDFQSKEVIVVDDGSTDQTPAVLSSLGDKIRVITQENGGPPRARNRGMKEARGEYFAFLDADDFWLPWKLAAQVQYLDANPDVGMAYSAWQIWLPGSDGTFRSPVVSAPAGDSLVDEEYSGFIYNQLLLSCVVHTSTVMVRRSIVEEVGSFDAGLVNGDDYDYWLRTSRVTEIHKLREVLSLYRIVPSGISGTLRPVNHEFEVVRMAMDRWGLVGPTGISTPESVIRKRLASLLFAFAYRHFHGGSNGTARRTLLEQLRYTPLSLKVWLYLLLTIVPLHRVARVRRADSVA
jgi:glycosyltransferase involved in cell wall biosynthesis